MKKSNKIIVRISLIISLLAIAAIAVTLFSAFGNRAPGWHNGLGIVKYYVDEQGALADGYQLVGGKPYYFNAYGIPAKEGWIRDTETDSELYYCIGDGELATGWHYIDDKARYFYRKGDLQREDSAGEVARSYTTSGGFYIGDKGYIDGEEGEAIGYGVNVLNRYGWDLTTAFKYASSLRYADDRTTDYGLKVHLCALKAFRDGEGNCLAWSGTFCTLARILGYDCKMVWGTLHFRGEDVTHAWTEIWEDDGPHVYDPRKNGGKDLGGFNVHYGDKGTYHYNVDSIQYLDW